MKIIIAIIIMFLSSWIASLFIKNILPNKIKDLFYKNKSFETGGLIETGVIFGSNFLIILSIYLCFDFLKATFYSSLIFAHWAYLAYFIIQKFSTKLDKPMLLLKKPKALTKYMNISSVFLIASINIYFDSLIGGLLACILMWIVYGLISAEIAILIVMKKRKFNRKKAIFAINFDNNKISLFSTKKYIFP